MSGQLDMRLSSHQITKPRNVEQIVQAAKEYEYNAQIPVRYWLRTAAALLKEADIYMREGDDETTYLLLFRHAHLVLAHLEAHPDARDKSIKPLLQQARREVDQNLKTLDTLKPRINQRYERFAVLLQEREARKKSLFGSPSDEEHAQTRNAVLTSEPRIHKLHGYENSDLAVRIAQQEYQRRATEREALSPSPHQQSDDKDDLSRRLQAVRSRVDSGGVAEAENIHREQDRWSSGTGYNYPSVKHQQPRHVYESSMDMRTQQASVTFREPSLPPTVPPKPIKPETIVAPPRPEKLRGFQDDHVVTAKAASEPTYTFAPTAFLENGDPLRTIFLPPTLRTTFLRLAYQNTKANLETCGFLAGTLISNALFVSKLVIPAQISTSDTCEMTNESQLFDYVDSKADLMIIGWIHTHPSQTCFMSSRDLHTHAGYQMMLPESVAIVCAPSKGDTAHGGDWGIYRLTDPPGKMAILNCNKPGIFHPHDVENIYTDALRPGHVVEAKGLEFEVVDLRDS